MRLSRAATAEASLEERMKGADIALFAESMPEAYRAAFDADAIAAHAAIAARRGTRTTHVEIWKELPECVVGVLVVADDRPGFLAQLSAAVLSRAIDVISVHASCRRRPDGVVEAVDVLWIRRLLANGNVAPVRARDVTRLGALVEALVRGEPLASPSPPTPPAGPTPGASTRVRFEWDELEQVMVLTVEAVDRPGLLLAVTKTLFAEGLQIVGLRATTEPGPRGRGRRAIDRFSVVELDGAPLRRERLLTVQIAVLSAIETA